MILNKRLRAVSAAGVLALALAACGGGDDADSPDASTDGGTDDVSNEEDASGEGGELSGLIAIDGSSTVGPLSEVAAELYMQEQPGVQVTVAMSGTSGGFQQFCGGETEFNDASRPIKDEEIELCGDNGIAFDSIQVANDALSLVVNAENPLECISVDQARQIWDLDSEVATWGDVDGLDIPDDLAGETLTLYGPGSDSGTFDFFTEAINGEEGRIRLDYTDIGEDDHAAVTGVQGDVAAMGYIPYSYYQEAGDAVKGLAIDGGNGCVEPTLENVFDGSYAPLGRPLFVYASDTALAKPEALDFMGFYVENSTQIAELAGFVPMTDEQIAEQHAKIEQLVSG